MTKDGEHTVSNEPEKEPQRARGDMSGKAPDFTRRKDRVGKYLHPYLTDFVFDEFQAGYLEKEGLQDFMKSVPVPMRPSDVVDFHGGKGLQILQIARNMAWIIGIDPAFRYLPQYLQYMKKYFNTKLAGAIVTEGNKLAEEGKFEEAVIHFRAALVLEPDNLGAMYNYACGCRELYTRGAEDTDYVGSFKAESIEYFERITVLYPEFPQAYYFLGYVYLNMGLYLKAQLTWKTYLEKSVAESSAENHSPVDSQEVKEIRERLSQLEEPVAIEAGCNRILSGRFTEGIAALAPFRVSQYDNWWPLHYYLGLGYANIENDTEALNCFHTALQLNPSHVETMEELVKLYDKLGDDEKAGKYRKKIMIVRS